MNFTPTQLKIIAFSTAVARFNQPAVFSVLQHILRNRSLQQERNHDEEVRVRSVGTRSLGRHPGTATPIIRLLLGLLPEWVRLVLWDALRARYSGR
jgi:hypothetical protein